MNTITFNALDGVLRLTRLRDRLRCPQCEAVGTFKPHGGWFDRDDVRKVRRWMCKWCGHYSERGNPTAQVYFNETKKCWDFLNVNDAFSMPPGDKYQGPWPWRG